MSRRHSLVNKLVAEIIYQCYELGQAVDVEDEVKELKAYIKSLEDRIEQLQLEKTESA